MESWRFFYDNLYDRPSKSAFTGPTYGAATESPGHPWPRAFDGTRNTTTRFSGAAAAQQLTYTATWATPNRPKPVPGQWSVGLFNHNLKAAGFEKITIQADPASGPLTSVVEARFEDMPNLGGPLPTEGDTRDADYIWLSNRTDLVNEIDSVFVTIQNGSTAQTVEAFIGQIIVCAGYIDTEVGPVSPNDTQIQSTRALRRTASGNPSVNAALGQSQPFKVEFPLVSPTARDAWQTLFAWQRNGFPYMLHPHAVPSALLWSTTPGSSEINVVGKGGGWMATPNSGAAVLFNQMDRYTVRHAGIRHKGLYQWE